MTCNLTIEEKAFARRLVEKSRADDPTNPEESFICIPYVWEGGSAELMIRFPKQKHFSYYAHSVLLDVLVHERLIIRISETHYKIRQGLYDLVDRDFMEHNPLDNKKVLKWLVEEERAERLRRAFHAGEWAPKGLEIADYNGDIIYELKKHGLAILDSLVSAGMLMRDPSSGHGWKYTLLPEAYAAVDTDLAEAAQVERRVQIREALVQVNAAVLARKMNNYFDEGEVRELCRALEDIDYENLPGRTKKEKILSFIEYMDRRSVREKLIDAILRERPNIDWSSLFKD